MSFERAKQLLWARTYGLCEGCGAACARDPHHRQPRGMGGVHGAAQARSNDVRNLLALCRVEHDRVDAEPAWAQARGWLVPHPIDPYEVPVNIRTVNGSGWWYLLADGSFRWCDADEALVKLGLYGLT